MPLIAPSPSPSLKGGDEQWRRAVAWSKQARLQYMPEEKLSSSSVFRLPKPWLDNDTLCNTLVSLFGSRNTVIWEYSIRTSGLTIYAGAHRFYLELVTVDCLILAWRNLAF
jgi:hypothetical protein